MEHLLEVKNLSVSIDGPAGEVQAVRDVSFSLKKGEVLAIVGESGCGKSVLCKSIMKLLPPSAKIKEGSICVNGQDITCYREKEMQKLRGRVFSMIFQDPMTSLNPTIKIGKQIGEAVVIHNKNYTKEQVNKKVLELMELVGISHPKERYHQYPWQFSGGMRQRCVMVGTSSPLKYFFPFRLHGLFATSFIGSSLNCSFIESCKIVRCFLHICRHETFDILCMCTILSEIIQDRKHLSVS